MNPPRRAQGRPRLATQVEGRRWAVTRAGTVAPLQRPIYGGRSDPSPLQVAVLRALDDLGSGVPSLRQGPLSLSEAVRRWLRAQLEFDPSVPLFRRWEWQLAQNEAGVDTLTDIACHFEYFDAVGNVDKAALVATVRRWASQWQKDRRPS
jgi:hypothetical protein